MVMMNTFCYHINDLLKSQTKCQVYCVRLVNLLHDDDDDDYDDDDNDDDDDDDDNDDDDDGSRNKRKTVWKQVKRLKCLEMGEKLSSIYRHFWF